MEQNPTTLMACARIVTTQKAGPRKHTFVPMVTELFTQKGFARIVTSVPTTKSKDPLTNTSMKDLTSNNEHK